MLIAALKFVNSCDFDKYHLSYFTAFQNCVYACKNTVSCGALSKWRPFAHLWLAHLLYSKCCLQFKIHTVSKTARPSAGWTLPYTG